MSEHPTPNGPIDFDHHTARRQLLEAGLVVSARTRERTTGETWARWERGGVGMASVIVEQVDSGIPNLPLLSTYRWASGFESVEDWQAAIADYCGGDLPEKVYLYRVTLIHLRDNFRERYLEGANATQ